MNGMMKKTNETGMTDQEPGMEDNRLSLNPTDFPVVKDWEDGEEYDLAELGEGTKLRQISMGEFEVVAGEAVAEEEAAPEEEAEAAATAAPRRGGNPAVERLIASKA